MDKVLAIDQVLATDKVLHQSIVCVGVWSFGVGSEWIEYERRLGASRVGDGPG
jgi:hypothetical protein